VAWPIARIPADVDLAVTVTVAVHGGAVLLSLSFLSLFLLLVSTLHAHSPQVG
jgi:hypothetical protein